MRGFGKDFTGAETLYDKENKTIKIMSNLPEQIHEQLKLRIKQLVPELKEVIFEDAPATDKSSVEEMAKE